MTEPDPNNPKKKRLTVAEITGIASAVIAAIGLVPPFVSLAKNPDSSTINNTTNNNFAMVLIDRWKDGSQIIRNVVSSEAAAPQAQRQGPFELSFESIEISQAPLGRSESALQATAGVRIKNMENVGIRVAVVNPTPTLQTEGGILFNIANHGVKGIDSEFRTFVRLCDNAKQMMTLLAPNQTATASLTFNANIGAREVKDITTARLSGVILVQRDGEPDCSKQSFSGSSIPARLSR